MAVVELGALSLIACVLVLVQLIRTSRSLLEERLLRNLILTVMGVIILDTINILEKDPAVSEILKNLFYADTILLGFFWFALNHFSHFNSTYRFRLWLVPVFFPLIMGLLGCAFNIINTIYLHRDLSLGFFHFWQVIAFIYTSYIFIGSKLSFRSARSAATNFYKKIHLLRTFIMFPSILAFIINEFLQELFIFPLILTFSLIHLYIARQHRKISIDPLTGLNNEYKLNEHLMNVSQRQSSSLRLFIVVFSIDNFGELRKINGQKKANKVLKTFAKFMQEESNHQENTLLARFDRHRFILVMERDRFSQVEDFCKMITADSQKLTAVEDPKWPLTFCIHWAEYGAPTALNIKDLMNDWQGRIYKPATPLPR